MRIVQGARRSDDCMVRRKLDQEGRCDEKILVEGGGDVDFIEGWENGCIKTLAVL